MRRKGRRLHLVKQNHYQPAHSYIRVLEPRNQGTGVLRDRRNLQLAAQRRDCLPAYVVIGVVEFGDDAVGVIGEHRRLQRAQQIQCPTAHSPIRVIEMQDHDIGVHRDLLRRALLENLQHVVCPLTHVWSGVLEKRVTRHNLIPVLFWIVDPLMLVLAVA